MIEYEPAGAADRSVINTMCGLSHKIRNTVNYELRYGLTHSAKNADPADRDVELSLPSFGTIWELVQTKYGTQLFRMPEEMSRAIAQYAYNSFMKDLPDGVLLASGYRETKIRFLPFARSGDPGILIFPDSCCDLSGMSFTFSVRTGYKTCQEIEIPVPALKPVSADTDILHKIAVLFVPSKSRYIQCLSAAEDSRPFAPFKAEQNRTKRQLVAVANTYLYNTNMDRLLEPIPDSRPTVISKPITDLSYFEACYLHELGLECNRLRTYAIEKNEEVYKEMHHMLQFFQMKARVQKDGICPLLPADIAHHTLRMLYSEYSQAFDQYHKTGKLALPKSHSENFVAPIRFSVSTAVKKERRVVKLPKRQKGKIDMSFGALIVPVQFDVPDPPDKNAKLRWVTIRPDPEKDRLIVDFAFKQITSADDHEESCADKKIPLQMTSEVANKN